VVGDFEFGQISLDIGANFPAGLAHHGPRRWR
jgi:hypothetical protein